MIPTERPNNVEYKLHARNGKYRNFEECFAAKFADLPFREDAKVFMKNSWNNLVIEDSIKSGEPVAELLYGDRRVMAISADKMDFLMDQVYRSWENSRNRQYEKDYRAYKLYEAYQR